MLRPRLSRRRAVSALLIALAAGAGAWLARPRIPWTSQAPGAFPAVLSEQHAQLARVADVAPAGSFVHSGHRAGAYQDYAIDLRAAAPRPLKPKRVVDLMTRTYTQYGLNAIEIDVRASPFDDRTLVIVHDRIPEEPPARAYCEQNTLRELLRAWVADGHAAKGREIFLELKAPRKALDDEARSSADRLAPVLADVCGDRPALRGLLHVISFSFAMLERARAGLGPAATRHRFLQVLTSNRYPEWVYDLYGKLPIFDEAAQERLRVTPWLDGAFFDPRFVRGFAELFNGINAARERAKLRPLGWHLGTYSHTWPELIARLEAEPQRLRHVRGMIHQIRSPK